MIEVGLALWIVAIGAVATVPVAVVRKPLLHAVSILPAGYAVYVVAALGLTIAGRFSAITTLILASTLAVAGASGWLARVGRTAVPWRRVGVEVAAVAAAAATIAALAQVIHLTRMTPDSMTYVLSSGGLERTGGLETLGVAAVLKRLLVVPALEAPGALTGRGYVASVMPLFGAAGLALTGRLAYAALQIVSAPRRWIWPLLGTATAFLVTTNRVVFNVAYIHTHMVFATFLLLGAGMAWLALQLRRWELLVPAALGFAALPMIRAEAVIVVLIFLVPLVTELAIPAKGRWALAGGVAVTTLAWFGLAAPPHVATSDLTITGPVLSNLGGVIGLLALVAATHLRSLRRLTAAAPLLVVAGLAAFVAIGAVRNPELFQATVAAMAANLSILGGWGTFWPIAATLLVLAAVTLRVPGERLLVYPLVAYGLAIPAFAFLRDGGYRDGPGDSGNRMMMHVVFIIMVYLVAAAGAAAAEAAAETADAEDSVASPDTVRVR